MHRFKRFNRTKLDTIKSLKRVTVESLILGPKKLRNVVLVPPGELKSGFHVLSARSFAAAIDSAVLYEMPSSCNVFRIEVCLLIRLI